MVRRAVRDQRLQPHGVAVALPAQPANLGQPFPQRGGGRGRGLKPKSAVICRCETLHIVIEHFDLRHNVRQLRRMLSIMPDAIMISSSGVRSRMVLAAVCALASAVRVDWTAVMVDLDEIRPHLRHRQDAGA